MVDVLDMRMDTFSQDILHTQEQNLALQHELFEYKKNTDEQLQYLKVKKEKLNFRKDEVNTVYIIIIL